MAQTFAECLADVQFVIARYQFLGSDEDELSYNKGDVIVVTKKDEGGWWEGTLDGKIGWFPKNYVKEIPADPGSLPDQFPASTLTEENVAYHNQVVDSMLQAQKGHVEELKNFLEKYLLPLKESSVLRKHAYETLCGNYADIVDFHKQLEKQLEEEQAKPIQQQRFGACMLSVWPKMKSLYLDYCSNHPQAANLLAQFGDSLGEFMESKDAPPPGIRMLTMLLSKPFTYVEKYGKQIRELQRMVEDNHIDNLDLKKSTQVLQIIALSCHEVRKKKEMELQMLTGNIEGWQGESMSALGSLIITGQVFVEKDDIGRRERYFCLFANDLIVLSVSQDATGYCFEERHAVSQISGQNIEDTNDFFNAFILTVGEKKWKVMTSTPREKDAWLRSLKKVLGERCDLQIEIRKPDGSSLVRTDSKRHQVQSMPLEEIRDGPIIRSFSTGSTGVAFKPLFKSAGSSSTADLLAPPVVVEPSALVKSTARQPVKKEWSFTRLRPTPPWQPNTDLKPGEDYVSSPRTIRRLVTSKKNTLKGVSKEDMDIFFPRKHSSPNLTTTTQILEEDMMILSVIEAYCFSAKQRPAVNFEGSANQLNLTSNSSSSLDDSVQTSTLPDAASSEFDEDEDSDQDLLSGKRAKRVPVFARGCLCYGSKSKAKMNRNSDVYAPYSEKVDNVGDADNNSDLNLNQARESFYLVPCDKETKL